MTPPFPYRLIATCPSSRRASSSQNYGTMIQSATRWAELDGWDAMLIYTNNSLADPWAIAQWMLQNTKTIHPLVAVQPFYAHPFTVANAVLTLASFYGRAIHINFVAGDYPRDRAALGDKTAHDKRYERLVEYGIIVTRLLASRTPVSFSGDFYSIQDLHLFAQLPHALQPKLTVSGSSAPGLAAARALGACAVQYPKPSSEYCAILPDPALSYGLRIGIVVRDTADAAWAVARHRFPESEDGTAVRQAATTASDSVWVKELARDLSMPAGHPYWLGPYRNYQSSCPFIVGCVSDVAAELAAYMRAGFDTFLVEAPEDRPDSAAITAAFRAAYIMAQSEPR